MSAKEKNHLQKCLPVAFFSDPDRIQTCNLLIRSQMLYSVELRGHFEGAKVENFQEYAKKNIIE